MPTFHYLSFRTSAHATEDPAKVAQALKLFFPEAQPETTVLEGHHGNEIRLIEGEVKDRASYDAFWRVVLSIPHAREKLLRELDDRLDEDLNFFLRLSKQDAYEGRAVFARDDDAIHVRAKIAAFPTRREVAREVLARFLTPRDRQP